MPTEGKDWPADFWVFELKRQRKHYFFTGDTVRWGPIDCDSTWESLDEEGKPSIPTAIAKEALYWLPPKKNTLDQAKRDGEWSLIGEPKFLPCPSDTSIHHVVLRLTVQQAIDWLNLRKIKFRTGQTFSEDARAWCTQNNINLSVGLVYCPGGRAGVAVPTWWSARPGTWNKTVAEIPATPAENVNATDKTKQSEETDGTAITASAPLTERAKLVLVVLLRGKVFDSDHRMRTSDIAEKAAGKNADPNQYKEVIAALKGLGYVDTKEGRGGGCWLTAAGQHRAEKL